MNLLNQKQTRSWFAAFEHASPLLNALALTAFSSLLIGLVFGGALFGTVVPDGFVLSFQSWLQHLLSPFSTWKFAQGQMALLHPIIDVLSGEWYGLRPFAYALFAVLWVLSVGLLFRCFQKGWNALGYKQHLNWRRFLVGMVGLFVLPLAALTLLGWIASPFEPFLFESPWLKIFFMGLVAWVFYAGLILWSAPKGVRVYAVLVGASIGALAFVVLEPAAQWVVTTYGPFSFLTHSMVFLVWNFCLWFSLCVGFVVLLKRVDAPSNLMRVPLGDRLGLCLRVLKALSKRAIRDGKTDHTKRDLVKLVDVPHDALTTTLTFLVHHGFVRQSKKNILGAGVEWQLTAPLNKLSMQKLLKDVDGSVKSVHLSKQPDAGSDQAGTDALAKLETYWGGGSIAEFLDWQFEQDQPKAKPETKPVVPVAEILDVEPVSNVITWFEPELYLQTDTSPDASDDTTLDDVQQAIANVKAETLAAEQAEKDDQPSIGEIIRKLSVDKP